MPSSKLTAEGITQRILESLEDDDRTISWLSRKTGIADSTLRYQLDNPERLTVPNWLKIADALGVSIVDLAVAA